ncbi:MAG: hypothetical protein J7K00_01960 [Candidatus Diapherotrites archaeon]|nr:hypothetical protein [Candidatus Diapherotrites archaeon]
MSVSDMIPDWLYDAYDSVFDYLTDFYEGADEFCWDALDSIEDKGVPSASLWENTGISPVAIPALFLVILAFLLFPMVFPAQTTFSAVVLMDHIEDYQGFEAKLVLESDDGAQFSENVKSPERKVLFEGLAKGSYSVDLQKDGKSVCQKFLSLKTLVVEENESLLVFNLKSCLDEAVEENPDFSPDYSSGVVKVTVHNSVNAGAVVSASVELKDFETKTVVSSGVSDGSGRADIRTESGKELYVFVSKEGFVDESTSSFKVKAGSVEVRNVSITPIEKAEKGRFNVCVKAGKTVAKQATVIVFNDEDHEIARGETTNTGCVLFKGIPANAQVYANVTGYSLYSDYRIKRLVRIFAGGLAEQKITLFKGAPLRIKVLAAGEAVTDKVKVTLWSSFDEKIRGSESDGSLSVSSLPWTEIIMLEPNFKYKVMVTGVPLEFKEFKSRIYSMDSKGVDLPIRLEFAVSPENLIIQDVMPNYAVALGEDFVLSAKVFAGTNLVKNAMVTYRSGDSSSFKPMVFDNGLLAYKAGISAPLTDKSMVFTIKAEWGVSGVHLSAEKTFTVTVSANSEQELSVVFYFGSEDEEHNGTSYTRDVPKGVDAGPVKVRVVRRVTDDGEAYGKILDLDDDVNVFASSVQFGFSDKKLTEYLSSECVFVLRDLDVPSNPEFSSYVVDLRAVQTGSEPAVGSASFKLKPVESDSGELVFADVSASPLVVAPGEEVDVEAIVKWANSVSSEATVELSAPSFSPETIEMTYSPQIGKYKAILTAPSEEGTYPIHLEALFVYSAMEYKAAFDGISIVVSENPEQMLRVAIKDGDDYLFVPLEFTKPVEAKVKDIGIRVFDFEGNRLEQVDNVTVKYSEPLVEPIEKDANFKEDSSEWMIEEILVPSDVAGTDLSFTVSAGQSGTLVSATGENYINIHVISDEENDCSVTECSSDEAARYLWRMIKDTWDNASVSSNNWLNPASSREVKIELSEPMSYSVFSDAAFVPYDSHHLHCVSSDEELCFDMIEDDRDSTPLNSLDPKGKSIAWRLGDTSLSSDPLMAYIWKKTLGSEENHDIALEKTRSGGGPCLMRIAYGDSKEKETAESIAEKIGVPLENVKSFDELYSDPDRDNYNIVLVWSAQQDSSASGNPQDPESVNLLAAVNDPASGNPVFYCVNGPGSEKSVFIGYGGNAFIGESYAVYPAKVGANMWIVVAAITDNALVYAKDNVFIPKFNESPFKPSQICDEPLATVGPLVGDISADSGEMKAFNTVVLFDDRQADNGSGNSISLFSDFADDSFKKCVTPSSEWDDFRKAVVPISFARGIFGSDSSIMSAFSRYHKIVVGHPGEDSLLRYLNGKCGVDWVYGSFSAFTGACSTKRTYQNVSGTGSYSATALQICDNGKLVKDDYGYLKQLGFFDMVSLFLLDSKADFPSMIDGSEDLRVLTTEELDAPTTDISQNRLECCRLGRAHSSLTVSKGCTGGCSNCGPPPEPACDWPKKTDAQLNSLLVKYLPSGKKVYKSNNCHTVSSGNPPTCSGCAGSAYYYRCLFSCTAFVECNQCYPQYVGSFWGLKGGSEGVNRYALNSWEDIAQSGKCDDFNGKKLVLFTGMNEESMREITKDSVPCGGTTHIKNESNSGSDKQQERSTCGGTDNPISFDHSNIDSSSVCQGSDVPSSCGIEVLFENSREVWEDDGLLKAGTTIKVTNTSEEKVSDISFSVEVLNAKFADGTDSISFEKFELDAGATKEEELDYNVELSDFAEMIIEDTEESNKAFSAVLNQPAMEVMVGACGKIRQLTHKTKTVYGIFAVYNNSEDNSLGGMILNLKQGDAKVSDFGEKLVGRYTSDGDSLEAISSGQGNNCGASSYCSATHADNSVFKVYSTEKLSAKLGEKLGSDQYFILLFYHTYPIDESDLAVSYNLFLAPMVKSENSTCSSAISNESDDLCGDDKFIDKGDFGCSTWDFESSWWCDDSGDDDEYHNINTGVAVNTVVFPAAAGDSVLTFSAAQEKNAFEQESSISFADDPLAVDTFQENTGTCSPNMNSFCSGLKYWRKNEISAGDLKDYLEHENVLFDDSGSVPNIYNFKNFGTWANSDCNANYIKEMWESHIP